MDPFILLENPDFIKEQLPLLQVICYYYLNEDFNFSSSQFEMLSTHLSPSIIMFFTTECAIHPDIYDKMKSPGYNVPKTVDEVNKLYRSPPVEVVTQVMCSSDEVVPKIIEPIVEVPAVEMPWHEEYCIPVEQVYEVVSDLPPCDAPLDIKSIDSLEKPESKKSIRNRMRAARHAQSRGYNLDRDCELLQGERNNIYTIQSDPPDVSVYELSSKVLIPKTIDTIIYAPPCSGKSVFNSKADYKFADTDYLHHWRTVVQPKVITNMHHLVKYAKTSIAIIPSRSVFEARCRRRGLDPPTSWYTDMLSNALEATHVIYSDQYLANIDDPWLQEQLRSSTKE